MNTNLLAASVLTIVAAQTNAVVLDQALVTDPNRQARYELANWIHSGIGDYIMRLKKHCICEYSGEEFAINVRNHQVVDIVHTTTGEPLPNEHWQLFPTVDRLHAMIIAQSPTAYEVMAEYDLQWNVPVRLAIDPEGSVDGDEMTYEVTRFLPIMNRWQDVSLPNQFRIDLR